MSTKTPPEVQWLDPETLTEDPGNPRTIDAGNRDRLREVLDRFGFVENLVLNSRTGELVSGHQRRALALELGIDSVPVMVVDLPEAEARALAVALNNPSAQGAWQPELLEARLEELASLDVLELTAFDPDELVAFGFPPETEEDETERVAFDAKRGRDPEAGERPDEPETETGDVWELGPHRVVCADAFDLDVRALNEGAVDLVLTDPPFAIFGSSTGVASDVTDDRMVRPFFASVARAAAAALDPHGHAYVHCDWRSWAALWEGFRAGGLAVRNMIVWDKGGAGLGSNYANTHELLAFAHYVPKASNTFDNRRNSEYRPVYASNVIRQDRPRGDERHHNAAKPVPLLEQLIINSTGAGPEGAVRSGEAIEDPVVLDLFAGSGSTLIAAENVGAVCIAVDVDPGWCDVIVKRWRDLTGKKGRRRKGKALDYLAPEDEPA
jgi:DNA modification methylase